MSPVIIGVDPHKRSVTIEIVDGRGRPLGQGRFADFDFTGADVIDVGLS